MSAEAARLAAAAAIYRQRGRAICYAPGVIRDGAWHPPRGEVLTCCRHLTGGQLRHHFASATHLARRYHVHRVDLLRTAWLIDAATWGKWPKT